MGLYIVCKLKISYDFLVPLKHLDCIPADELLIDLVLQRFFNMGDRMFNASFKNRWKRTCFLILGQFDRFFSDFHRTLTFQS